MNVAISTHLQRHHCCVNKKIHKKLPVFTYDECTSAYSLLLLAQDTYM